MPYTITWKEKEVVWTFYGVVTGDDVIQANLDIYGDPRFDDLRYQVVDLLKVERFDLPHDDLETAAAMDEAATLSNPRLAVAVIAVREDAVKTAELYKTAMRGSSWEVGVFGSMEEAERWLRLSWEE